MTINRPLLIFLFVLTTVMLALTLVFNYLSTTVSGSNIGMFSKNNTIAWTRRGSLTASNLTPQGFAFTIWAVIYVYQAAFLAYCLSLLIRKGPEGVPLCCVPGLLPPGLLAAHTASSVFNIAWVFLSDQAPFNKTQLIPQTCVLFLTVAALWLGLGFSFYHLSTNRKKLQQEGLGLEYWLVIALQQNACGLYGGWVFIASFLNMDIAIINIASYSADSSGLLCLCQVALLFGAYIVADFSFLDRYFRFLFAPYLSILWALSTAAAGNYQAGVARSDVTIELAVVAAGALIAKVINAVIRQVKLDPLPCKEASGKVADEKQANA